MELGYWGTNIALGFHLVHFIALRSNFNHAEYHLEPIILQLSTLFPLGSYWSCFSFSFSLTVTAFETKLDAVIETLDSLVRR